MSKHVKLENCYCRACGKLLTIHIKQTGTFDFYTGEAFYNIIFTCSKKHWYNNHTRCVNKTNYTLSDIDFGDVSNDTIETS